LSDKLAGTLLTFLSPAFWGDAWHQFSLGIASTESIHYSGGGGSAGESYVANILGRFFYWGIAIGLWLRSPFFGIGSFRFNDVDMGFWGVEGFVQFATSGIDRSDDLIGAHNQYLGVLVENGLVGLAVLLSIWIVPYRLIARRASPPQQLRESGRQMVPFAFGTALTGYTLVSPTLTFVALTWLMLVCWCEDVPP
jgi:O-antigen ligase